VKEYPYWWDTVGPNQSPFDFAQGDPEPVEGSAGGSFDLPHKADVVVVGAGYTGLSAARRLAFAGASVVVLERERDEADGDAGEEIRDEGVAGVRPEQDDGFRQPAVGHGRYV